MVVNKKPVGFSKSDRFATNINIFDALTISDKYGMIKMFSENIENGYYFNNRFKGLFSAKNGFKSEYGIVKEGEPMTYAPIS